jgi:hypothetical protein
MNNMLGTTAGINDVLESESSLYSFNENDPNEACP